MHFNFSRFRALGPVRAEPPGLISMLQSTPLNRVATESSQLTTLILAFVFICFHPAQGLHPSLRSSNCVKAGISTTGKAFRGLPRFYTGTVCFSDAKAARLYFAAYGNRKKKKEKKKRFFPLFDGESSGPNTSPVSLAVLEKHSPDFPVFFCNDS